MMTWTRDSTHDWRDMSVEAGLGYEATPCSDRYLIHARRDMSVEARHDYEATWLSDRDSIETRRDMSVTKPPHETAVHHRSRLIFEKLTFIKKLEKWKGDFGF